MCYSLVQVSMKGGQKSVEFSKSFKLIGNYFMYVGSVDQRAWKIFIQSTIDGQQARIYYAAKLFCLFEELVVAGQHSSESDITAIHLLPGLRHILLRDVKGLNHRFDIVLSSKLEHVLNLLRRPNSRTTNMDAIKEVEHGNQLKLHTSRRRGDEGETAVWPEHGDHFGERLMIEVGASIDNQVQSVVVL
ncbi:hypothetical protein OGATHE_006767 [Ogataea polymorpha]|uniref:Uncharacterized protein n=1 Tax=Ogataea polymorpha TaxID=460523 RepID=A0A9P8SXZ5_9ASCO|nr:hypothetical protein OGATHE_006767 [Ogataea polymorpha]